MKYRSTFVPPLIRPVGARQASFHLPHQTSPIMMPMPIRPCSLPPLQSHHGLVVATATTAVTQTSSFAGFVHLFLSFIAGGIFFSSLLAGATTFFAIGASNISRIWSLAKIVIRQVWTVFCTGLNEARLALRMDGEWRPGQAWQVLKSKLGETKQAAAEGMNAMKTEKALYAGAVGQPGLVLAQYFLNRLMPFSLTTQMENALRNSLQGITNDVIKTIHLEDFSAGNVNPTLLEARNYDLGKDALAFDVDVRWDSACYAKMSITTRRIGIKVPVTVKNATFVGTARVELTPLTKEPPGWGAILVSLASVPKIGLRLDTVGGDLTKIPWLKKEITKALQKAIQDELLWPKRLVLPSLTVPPNSKTVISKTELDQLSNSDPLLKAEGVLEQQGLLKDHMDSMKPNVTAIPSSLDVSVGDENNDSSNATDKNAHEDKRTNPFANFVQNLKNKTMRMSSAHHHNDEPTSSVGHGSNKNGTSVPGSDAVLINPGKKEKVT